MIVLPCDTQLDILKIAQINRFTDMVNIYIVETVADYDALPQSIKDMLGPDQLLILKTP